MEHARRIGARSRVLALMMAALLVAACGGDDEEAEAADAAASPPPVTSSPATSPPPAAVPAGSAPQISGTPRALAAVNQPYSFAPIAVDADGDKLTFKATNRPSWLALNASTGQLKGTPTAADVGTYRGITIEVTDGSFSRTLRPFDIQVVAVGAHGVRLSWLPPTQNEDGSALTNLAGYRIRYGYEPGSYPNTISVTNPGLATYYVEGLVPNTYYFVISAYNTGGVESAHSNEAVINL